MNIVVMNLRRIFKRKINLIFMLASPFIMVMFASMMGNTSWDLKIAYVDYDNSATSKQIIEELGEVGSTYEINEEAANINLVQSNYDLFIKIDEGFEKSVLENKSPIVYMKTLQGSELSYPAKLKVESYLSSVSLLAKKSDGDQELFLSMLEDYNEGMSSVKIETTQSVKNKRYTTRMSIGFLIMNMFFLASINTQMILEDKRKKVFYRVFTGPITVKRYMFENILSFFIVMLAQVGIIMFAMFGVFGMYYGDALFDIFLVLSLFGLMCVAFGMAITTLSKNERQANVMSTVLIVPLCMLGGCFWDIEMMPSFLQRLANFIPASWGIKSVMGLLEGKSIGDISFEILVMALFTAVFFVLGSLRKVDISK